MYYDSSEEIYKFRYVLLESVPVVRLPSRSHKVSNPFILFLLAAYFILITLYRCITNIPIPLILQTA